MLGRASTRGVRGAAARLIALTVAALLASAIPSPTVEIARADGGLSIPPACASQDLSSDRTSADGRIRVVYDPRFLHILPDLQYDTGADVAAEAVLNRADDSLVEYGVEGYPIDDLPQPVTIRITCRFSVVFIPNDRNAFTADAGTIELKADWFRGQIAPYVLSQTSEIARSEWANVVDHELAHTFQYEAMGRLWTSTPALWIRDAIQNDHSNIEGSATLAQDVLGSADDYPDQKFQSFLQNANGFLSDPTPIDVMSASAAAYRAAAFYEYLAERFGDNTKPDLEQRVVDMAQRFYSGPVHLKGVADAIGVSTTGPVIDALRDFYVTAYVRTAPNRAALPTKFRILDELIAHGATPPQSPPETISHPWGALTKVNRTHAEPLMVTARAEYPGQSLAATAGAVYELPLESGLERVRVTVDDSSAFVARQHFEPLRLAVIPSANGSPTASGSPSLGQTRIVKGPGRGQTAHWDLTVNGMNTLGIVVVAGTTTASYSLTIEALVGTPWLSLDAISSVSECDQSNGIQVFVHAAMDGQPVTGLPPLAFASTIDSGPASVASSFDLGGGTYMVFVKPLGNLSAGPHSLRVDWGTAWDSGDLEITGCGETRVEASYGSSDTLQWQLTLGGAAEAGMPIELRFVLTDAGVGLPGTWASATITDPNNVVRHVHLFDDGSTLDSDAGDGAYGAYAFGTNVAGTYTVSVGANGIDSNGNQFSLTADETITLGQMVDVDSDGVADGLADQFGPGDEDPDADGATTAVELGAGSDPLNPDTDEGGESDASEITSGREPSLPDDDEPISPVLVTATATDGRLVELTAVARDGETPVRVYRVHEDTTTDLGQHSGAGEAFTDGPLAAGSYAYWAVAEPVDGARNAPVSSGPVVVQDAVTPPSVRFYVNDGSISTNQRVIAITFLDLSVPAVDMRIAESIEALETADWVPYEEETTFTLSAHDGVHQLFAQVRDANALVSAPAYGAIDLNTSPSYEEAVLADAPLAYWRLAETTGTSAVDATGNGHTGTYTGGFTLAASGALLGDTDTAATLNGTTGYVSVAAGSGLPTGNTFSFETWFRASSLNDPALADTGPDGTGWEIDLNPSGVALWAGEGGSTLVKHTSAGLSTDTWYHLVVTKTGADTHLYLNGDDVTAEDGSDVTLGTNTNPLRLGNQAGATSWFSGTLDEVALYDQALSPARVLAHYTAATTPPPPPTSTAYPQAVLADAPLAYWRLDESSGTLAVDASGNSKAASYTGGFTLGQTGALTGDDDTAASVDGSTGYVALADAPSLAAGAFSVEGWAKFDTLGSSWRPIVTQDSWNAASGFLLYYDPSASMLYFGAAGSGTEVAYNWDPTPGTWYDIAATWDGTTGKVYLDGSQVASATLAITPNTQSIYLGARHGNGGSGMADPFSGTLDEVALYDQALSPARVLAHYTAGTTP